MRGMYRKLETAVVIPCYNEEKVLPHTNPMFIEKIESLINSGQVHPNSKVMYVNDGSKDKTWELIQQYAKENNLTYKVE